MKAKIFFITTCLLLSNIFSSTTVDKVLRKPDQDSFNYFRLGIFSWLYYPCGLEMALGSRIHSGKWAYGPCVNVSTSAFLLPAVSLKFEWLYFPHNHGGYLGFMPSVGMAYDTGLTLGCSHRSRGWISIANIEFILGKEYWSSSHKKRFFYFSVNPCLVCSLNYGWGF